MQEKMRQLANDRLKEHMAKYAPYKNDEMIMRLHMNISELRAKLTLTKLNFLRAREADEKRRLLNGQARENLFKKGSF